MKTAFSSFIYSRRGIYGILHILILLMSLFLVISISIDTFHNIPFLNQGSYLKIQFWICMFSCSIPAGVFLSKKKEDTSPAILFPAGIYTLFKYH